MKYDYKYQSRQDMLFVKNFDAAINSSYGKLKYRSPSGQAVN